MTNTEVLINIHKRRQLFIILKRKITAYFEQTIRNGNHRLLKIISQGKVKGRIKIVCTRNLTEWLGISSAGVAGVLINRSKIQDKHLRNTSLPFNNSGQAVEDEEIKILNQLQILTLVS